MPPASAPTPQVCPPPDVLDRLELLRSGASTEPQVGLSVRGHEAVRAREAGGFEVVDPEGVPIAHVDISGVDDEGRVTTTPAWLGNPSPRPYERLYLSPAQVKTMMPVRSLALVVDRPLVRRDVVDIRRAASGRPVLMLALAGPSTSPYSPAVSIIRSCEAALSRLDDSRVVAVPLSAAQATAEPALQDEVVMAYAPGKVAWLEPRTTSLTGQTMSDTHGNGGLVVFFTGLSGSGKSTVARAVREAILEQDGRAVSILDGDIVRRHLSAGLGFSPEDRETNIRRIEWVAAEIAYHGGLAICSPIAPYASTRRTVREMTLDRGGEFLLVHVSTPVEVCEERDRKGLYAKARTGEIADFTGVSAPYEEPVDADLVLDTACMDICEARDAVLDLLRDRGHLADDEEPEWVI